MNPAPPLPRISIITPSFQQGDTIRQTIESVRLQDYPDFEHIVIDGGSDDCTVEVLRSYPHLRWVSEKDHGQAHAINKGLLMATGQIVAYLNSDDLYRPGALQAVGEAFRSHRAAQIVIGDCDYIDEDTRNTGFLRARCPSLEAVIRYWGWDRWYCIPQQSTFFRREVLAQVGLFDASLHFAMDYDMWLKILAIAPPLILPRTLAAFRLAPNTKTTSRTYGMYYEEIQVSRRWWKVVPARRRWRIAVAAHRHVSRKLIDFAEADAFRGQFRMRLIRDAVRYWPLRCVQPRALLTTAQWAACKITPALHAIRLLHGAYLTVRARLLATPIE